MRKIDVRRAASTIASSLRALAANHCVPKPNASPCNQGVGSPGGGDWEQQQRKRGEHLGEWGMQRLHPEVARLQIAVARRDLDRLVGGNRFLHGRANLHDAEVSEEGKD